ncbi:glycosyltransferase family 2 protein [Schaalia sp. 19OD2882]|uniref:glycosyltransferase family 2 protein n=1 Tax=Schaalia sp. 19OD2882 TaxID=2794089 RepID=UPI001C1EBFE5|nr:glycosyltransferase family 2 protein [Schaalia sp. 19OD2882]QWW20293.1 glycosyltransferase family 2 protein [Schaalia sp. 19OD2882]
MTHSPVVTIVMRTKDRTILLDRALADCAAQTFTDWELVIVNDGGSPTEVDSLLLAHAHSLAGRARVIHNAESRGMETASNQAISQSTGTYVCIHDDDDTWAPTFLDTCASFLRANPDLGGVAVRTEIVLEKIGKRRVSELGRFAAFPHIHHFSMSALLKSNIAVPISCMYPRAVIEDLGGFRDDLPVVGDWEFHIRLAVKYEVGFIDGKPLAFWHQRPTQKGVLGNSVFAGAQDHAYFEMRVRDEYLREYAQKNGVGILLWLATVLKDNSKTTPQSFVNDAATQARRFLAALPRT